MIHIPIKLPNVLGTRPVLAFFVGVFPQMFCFAAADTLLFYDFDNLAGDLELTPEVVVQGLAVSDWYTNASSLRDFAGDPGRAIAASGFAVENAFILPVSVAESDMIDINGFSFSQTASASGPVFWSLRIAGTEVASGNTAASFTTEMANVAIEPLFGDFLIELSASGASSNRGTLRIDNFTLTGDIQAVPLPASLLLLGSGLFGFLRINKWRAHR